MTPEQLAQIAYEAYAMHHARHGSDFPFHRWGLLDVAAQACWIAAAQAVKANVLSGFTKVGEGESLP